MFAQQRWCNMIKLQENLGRILPLIKNIFVPAGLFCFGLLCFYACGNISPATQNFLHLAFYGIITPDACETINAAKKAGKRIIAVGTTSLRLLESAADNQGIVRPFADDTSIFITPGYKFKILDMLITNFHLPKSTLFMLVCAVAGTERMKEAYNHAMEQKYHFYSYGDSSILKCVNKI